MHLRSSTYPTKEGNESLDFELRTPKYIYFVKTVEFRSRTRSLPSSPRFRRQKDREQVKKLIVIRFWNF